MSYILDALNKSDQDSKISDIPGLHSQHNQNPLETTRQWQRILIAVLCLNLMLALCIGWYFNDNRSQSDSTPIISKPEQSTQETAVLEETAPRKAAPRKAVPNEDSGAEFASPRGSSITAQSEPT